VCRANENRSFESSGRLVQTAVAIITSGSMSERILLHRQEVQHQGVSDGDDTLSAQRSRGVQNGLSSALLVASEFESGIRRGRGSTRPRGEAAIQRTRHQAGVLPTLPWHTCTMTAPGVVHAPRKLVWFHEGTSESAPPFNRASLQGPDTPMRSRYPMAEKAIVRPEARIAFCRKPRKRAIQILELLDADAWSWTGLEARRRSSKSKEIAGEARITAVGDCNWRRRNYRRQ